jgi:hypothetical protein
MPGVRILYMSGYTANILTQCIGLESAVEGEEHLLEREI